jgi:proline racemase
MPRTFRTIDAHCGGEPLRLIVDGFPAPRGRTMLDRRAWAERHADLVRRALMLEPRGHADMYGAVLTEPVAPGSHAGVLFMHNDGYSTMCGHGIIAVTTIALERGLMMPGGDGATIVYDTPAGSVRARASIETSSGQLRVARVAYVNVPSFVLHPGVTVRAVGRVLRADVAYGGAFYAIVDAESAGLPLDAAHLPELRRVGVEIREAVAAAVSVAHPLDQTLEGLYGTIFTGPPDDARADLRNVAVFARAEADRSPCGTGTAAVMAVIDAMGLLDPDRPFVHESLTGAQFTGRLAGRTTIGDVPAIVPEIEGAAWITGEHTFVVSEDDPLKEGFRL